MTAWGFTYKSELLPASEIIWDKVYGKMGHYARIAHEHLLIGIKGHPGQSAVHDIPSVIVAPAGTHSRKPPVFYSIIEHMYPEAGKVELFATRQPPYGWDAWGNHLDLATLPFSPPEVPQRPSTGEFFDPSQYKRKPRRKRPPRRVKEAS